MLRKRIPGVLIVFILTFCLLLGEAYTMPVWAGDGSGGGKNQPLALVTSVPAHGQSNVSLPVEIKLTFNKNVVYMTVRDNNQQCFALYSEDGQQVPADIIMADDQVEFEKRRDVIVKPRVGLQPGITYTVKVSPQLESKSGVNLGQQAVVSFTTAGVKTGENQVKNSTGENEKTTSQNRADTNEAVSSKVDDQVSKDNNQPVASISENDSHSGGHNDSRDDKNIEDDPASKIVKTGAAEQSPKSDPNNNFKITAALLALAVVIAGWALYKKKN
ncbi:Ig-like domain-containing protein [Syntrophomonas erecta]